MDSTTLVESGQNLVRELDRLGLPPTFAMWVKNPETDAWRLWIVPSGKSVDKREFYFKIAAILAANPEKFSGVDVGDVDFRTADHPAVSGMRSFMHVSGLSSVHLSNNMFNGFFIPDGILLRSEG